MEPWFRSIRDGRGLLPVHAMGWLTLLLYGLSILAAIWVAARLMADGRAWAALPVFGVGATLATVVMALIVYARTGEGEAAPRPPERKGRDA